VYGKLIHNKISTYDDILNMMYLPGKAEENHVNPPSG
jgi:hypothetical protein